MLDIDVAGVVEAVGKDVARFEQGDAVFGIGRGTYAEYARAPERKLAPNRTSPRATDASTSSSISAGTRRCRGCGRSSPRRARIVGGEGGGRWLGGFGRQMRASAQSLFVGQKQGTFISRENHEDITVLAELIEAGKVTPVVDRCYPLNEAAHAIRHIEEGRARGKVVVRVAATDGPR